MGNDNLRIRLGLSFRLTYGVMGVVHMLVWASVIMQRNLKLESTTLRLYSSLE